MRIAASLRTGSQKPLSTPLPSGRVAPTGGSRSARYAPLRHFTHMSSHGRRLDHWRTSLDAVEALRVRMAEVDGPQEDPVARQLMAQVAHAKSSSFIALLDADGPRARRQPGRADRRRRRPHRGHRPAAVDDAVVVGARRRGRRARSATRSRAAAEGRFARFDVDVRDRGRGRATGTLDLLLRPLRGRDGRVAFIVAEGRHDHRPQAGRGAARAPERGAVGADRAPRARARLPRAAARRALARPARAAAGRHHPLRAAAALRARRRTSASQVVNIRLAALGALEQINDMLEQVKADHGEARLALVDADLAQRRAHRRRVSSSRSPPTATIELDGRGAGRARGPLRRRAAEPHRLQPARQRDPPRARRRARSAASSSAGDGRRDAEGRRLRARRAARAPRPRVRALPLRARRRRPRRRRRRRPRPRDRARVRRAARRRDLARRRARGRRAVHRHAAAAPAGRASASRRRSPSTPPRRSGRSSCARTSRPSSPASRADAAGADGRHRRAGARAAPTRSSPASATARSRASPRTPSRRCGSPSSCARTRSSSAPTRATCRRRRCCAGSRPTSGSPGVRRVALAGEREADHSPEALIAAGAQLVLPAGGRRGARRPPVGGRDRARR